MPTIHTLGDPSKRTEFSYTGSVKEGVVLEVTGRPRISAEFFKAVLDCFKGAIISGEFSSKGLASGGLGAWIEYYSQEVNPVKLSPRHAPFIAAILVHEGYISTTQQGKAVYLHFP